MPKNNKNRNNLWVTDAEDFPTNTSVYVNNLALARARYAFTHQ